MQSIKITKNPWEFESDSDNTNFVNKLTNWTAKSASEKKLLLGVLQRKGHKLLELEKKSKEQKPFKQITVKMNTA